MAREGAEELTRRWLRKTRKIGNTIDWEAIPAAEFHAYRRRVRRLRYALQWTDRPRKTVKALAEDLGEMNDLSVLITRLERGELASPDVPPVDEVRARLA